MLNADVSVAVASYTISSTYINSTYDEYFVYFDALPASDNARFYVKAVVGGSVVTGTYLSWETNRVGGDYIAGNNVTTTTIMGNPTTAGMGNVSGEGITGYFHLQNVNSTTRPAGINGMVYWTYYDGGAPNGSIFSGMFQSTQASHVMNGIHFVFDGGNITTANFKLYGMKK